ncbi:MAG TPA: N-acylglucosamine 2-epimerase [Lentisphaeria bacterium]|nr:MAG: hypothetical protein A2X48_08770 [Lentisphaerae bacterium GWF2_49_21]HBC89025.1 N-acylglucosamine 2-epimerase [Lentisphaeria bacterium]
MNANRVIERYKSELLEYVTPFWENNCVDTEFGGYYSLLDREGKPFSTDKYMWMQWRIVYMFAIMYKTEYSRPEWLDIAEKGFDFLTKYGKKTDGGYYFALNREGVPLQEDCGQYTIFSESFTALGSAALYKATGNEKYKNESLAAANIFKRNIERSVETKLAGQTRRRTFGHYMILINLSYVMNECLDTDEYSSDIDSSIESVREFWNEDLGLMFENINIDGSFDLESCDGRLINPGHALEAMWFIMQYAEKKKDTALMKEICMLTSKILEYGWDKEYGGVYYFKDALDRPLLEPKTCLKIWWSNNEAAIAALYAFKLTGDHKFYNWFLKIDEWNWKSFRDPEFPEWFAYTDRSGKPCHFFKGSNWKSFFHLPRYLLNSIQLLEAVNK